LSEELKKENEAREQNQALQKEQEEKRKKIQLENFEKKQREQRMQEERERKAKAKMDKVRTLKETWDLSAAKEAEDKERKLSKKQKKIIEQQTQIIEEDVDGIFENEVVEEGGGVTAAALFDDSDDDDDDHHQLNVKPLAKEESKGQGTTEPSKETEKDLFGDSSTEEESDEELLPTAKRNKADSHGKSNKKQKTYSD